MKLVVFAIVCAVIVLTCLPASAEVSDKSPTGFTLKTTVQIAAPPESVYRALIDIGSWWSSNHTYSGVARNMSISPVPGGCFCEKLADGGGVEHGRVVYVAPGKLLRLTSSLGPLQELGVRGSWTWQIAPNGQGSTVTMTYAVGGYAQGGLDALAGPVDQVLSQQVASLKAHAEKAR